MPYPYTDTVGTLLSLVRSGSKPVILIGAGASRTSGILLAGELTELIAQEAFRRERGYPPEVPLQRSDWLPWFKDQPGYRADRTPTENYPFAVERFLRPKEIRREFFERIINPGIEPREGYRALASLIKEGLITTVLSTNFDECLEDAAHLNRQRPIAAIKTEADLVRFSISPKTGQLIYLHGSVSHYTDKNLEVEVEALPNKLITLLEPVLRDHPLIVVGYRGGERSIMKSFLQALLPLTNNFKNGIYWCLRGDSPSSCPLYVQELAASCDTNFSFVSIEGFDQLLDRDIWQALKKDGRAFTTNAVANNPDSGNGFQTFDSSLAVNAVPDTVEWSIVQHRLTEYSKRLDLPAPKLEKAALEMEMDRRGLGSIHDKTFTLTVSGCLLFTSHPQNVFPQATVRLVFRGPEAWLRRLGDDLTDADSVADTTEKSLTDRLVKGNLYRQISEITDVLSFINKAFRLKGEVSDTAYPYPPLAIKEVLVNALAHRDYTKQEPVVIEVEPALLRIVSPGGLVEDVRRQVAGESLEDQIIKNNRRGIKGYRNPVLADLLYGSGAMDKEGSGLADVYKWVKANAGTVTFGPSDDNERFAVTIYSRKEAVDEITKTASPLITRTTRCAINFLELVDIPKLVYSAATEHWKIGGVWKAAESDWLPVFCIRGGRLWTFSDLNDKRNPLHRVIEEGTQEVIGIDEFQEMESGNWFIELMNRSLFQHFKSMRLVSDDRKRRAYFPAERDSDQPRVQTYQARAKRATRTVAKPHIGSKGGVIYWEHQAFTFRLELLGTTWGIFINPGYAFTTKGWKDSVAPEKANSLSTKRASRDYNQSVHNSIYFWMRVLAGDNEEGMLVLQPDRKGEGDAFRSTLPRIAFASQLPTSTLNDVVLDDEFIEPEDDNPDEISLEDEIEALVNDQDD